MATKTQINKLTNCVAYINGTVRLGHIEELTLPDVDFTMAEHKALGMIGTAEFFAGLEKMETTVKWTSFYQTDLQENANPLKNVQFMVRGSLQTWDGSGLSQEVPAVVYLTCAYKSFPFGMFKKSENVEVTSKLATYYVKLEISGTTVIEVDVLANIWNTNGVDVLANYRANLGI